MKIQIVHLEAHDDVISTRDKMGWGQTNRIILVWPDKGALLDRPLDLILLQRHSQSLGAQLSLVTRDDEVCFNAEQLGIPTFPSLRKAQQPLRGSRTRRRVRRSPWARKLHLRTLRARVELLVLREQVRPQPSPLAAHPVIRLSSFTLGILAVLILMGMILPGATIHLEPRQQTQRLELPITASADFDLPKLTGEVPARWVSVVVEARDHLPATGQTFLPEKTASGSVTFTNLTAQVVEIPQGTIVRTAGENSVRFATTKAGRVPAGASRFLEIPVRALVPGAVGNLPARAVQLVEGDLGLKVSCHNASPLRGGSDLPVTSPSEADRKQLYASLTKALQNTARQELEAPDGSSLREGDFAILPSLKLVKVLEEKYQPEAGFPSNQLELTLRLEYQALIVSAGDYRAVVQPVLSASLPEGYSAVPGTLELQPLRAPTMTGEAAARWQVIATQTLQAAIAPEAVIQLVRGLRSEEALQRLSEALPLARQPVVQLFPSWWPVIPFLPLRIEVN